MQSSFSSDSIGVGLHLTHELVHVHKGNICYEENPSGGSIFIVTLPTDSSIYQSNDFLIPENAILKKKHKTILRFLLLMKKMLTLNQKKK